ncbi:phage head closure protein [Szabonella alba]|uniref:Phage head closure protein n=1 Tax=Szabonella alba TaxID=2804194 RepID=A0A8K0VC40_9RHOB|nr:phage head closure protein [Szabonella alba]MBL4918971.1 phage head closure protein [Szabonella alba]
MTAGRRKYPITVQEATESLSAAGSPVFTWTDKAQLRAEIVQQGTTEFLRDFGASDETVIVFRTIWAGEITTADRVRHAGRSFNIREVVPLGRRFGIELRCIALSGVN